MADRLDLNLPNRKPVPSGSAKFTAALLFCIFAAALGNLFMSFYNLRGKDTYVTGNGLTSEAVKELALKLEKRGLNDHAADIWKEYLAISNNSLKDKAKIWYRIGKLYQETESYEDALEAYYRSESTAHISELENDINRRIQESLESLGKFAALRYELNDRVDMKSGKNDSGTQALAEIGSQKITKADIDQYIEKQIERQLFSMRAYMPEEQLNKQKEALLKRFFNPEERLRLLNQIVLEEILFRKARENKLIEDPYVRKIIRDAERSILAQKVMEKELAARINITPGDLHRYYDARKQDYMEPEKAKISHILVKQQEEADAILKKIQEGIKFEELVKIHSIDDKTVDKDGEIESWVTRDSLVPSLGNSKEALSIIFSTEAGNAAKEAVKSEKGFHIIKVRERKPEQQKSFDEVRQEVYQALQAQKEREVSEMLLTQLKDRYNVVIHTSQFREESSQKNE